jgi:pimeloyl-ACP methyl ester carboxylesterase
MLHPPEKMLSLDRRQLMVALGALAGTFGAVRAGVASEPGSPFEERVLEVPGEKLARRCLLLLPRGPAATTRVLVLFHGLGETTSEQLGIRAWADRYGLVRAAERLGAPPVTRTLPGVPLLTEARLAELNDELARQPFRGLAVACPFTPNMFRQPSTALDHYAAWVAEALLPEVRRELGLGAEGGTFAVDGVSLGGYVSLEVFLRKPEVFAAAGATQGAFGANLADAYAARFERAFTSVGPRSLRIATSEWDSTRSASERLVTKLGARGIRATLALSPGGHDQRFLREVGSLELLHHYDRALPAPTVKRP